VYALSQAGDGTWNQYILHSFRYGDPGQTPTTTLVMDATHHLYGTGAEQIFELSPTAASSRTFSPVYNFSGGDDGDCSDLCSLSIDSAGNLYGSTAFGGAQAAGVVFRVSGGQYSVIYTFTGGSDGGYGLGSIAFDGSGNLYGTTVQGGAAGLGVVYRLSPTSDPSNWTYTVLHDFAGNSDGAQPEGLIMGSDGNLYGTTANGGDGFGGTVFRLTPNQDGTWTEGVIYAFQQNGVDGFFPLAVPTMDHDGNLYGTTAGGGSQQSFGTVYKLTQSNGEWSETLVHVFQGQPNDGMSPFGPVAIDNAGNVFGTTTQGGLYNNWGTVWEIAAD
jgi:uncharacterized repeat protein (TIGR03803 family)